MRSFLLASLLSNAAAFYQVYKLQDFSESVTIPSSLASQTFQPINCPLTAVTASNDCNANFCPDLLEPGTFYWYVLYKITHFYSIIYYKKQNSVFFKFQMEWTYVLIINKIQIELIIYKLY